MNRINLMFKFLFDKTIPFKEKWWAILPLIYIISPIDLIPAPIFGFSIIDDIIILGFLLSKINEKTKKYYENNDKKNYTKNKEEVINKDKIINDVDYEIK